jgi:hypothetical protein
MGEATSRTRAGLFRAVVPTSVPNSSIQATAQLTELTEQFSWRSLQRSGYGITTVTLVVLTLDVAIARQDYPPVPEQLAAIVSLGLSSPYWPSLLPRKNYGLDRQASAAQKKWLADAGASIAIAGPRGTGRAPARVPRRNRGSRATDQRAPHADLHRRGGPHRSGRPGEKIPVRGQGAIFGAPPGRFRLFTSSVAGVTLYVTQGTSCSTVAPTASYVGVAR